MEILYEFEINKIKNELLSLNSKSKSLINQKLNFLSQLLIEEFISGIKFRRMVLNALSDIATQSAGESYLSLPLLKTVNDLHLHLIGPKDVPLSNEDKKTLIKSLDIFGTVGSYAASLVDNEIVLKRTLMSIAELSGISSIYKFKDSILKIIKILKEIKKDVSDYNNPKFKKEQIEKRKRKRIKMIEETLNEIKKL